MAKGGSGVPAFNFLLLLFSSAVSQSVPPFYAGSYLEGSDGQAGDDRGGFYYGSPPQHFYYPDADSEYLSTNSYQEEARVASYEDGNQFYPQEETFQSEEVFGPLELAKGLVNTFNNLISGFKQADDRQEGGGDGGGGG